MASTTGRPKFAWRVASLLRRRNGLSPVAEESSSEDGSSTPREKEVHKKLRPDMIRRMDSPPKRVNPSGWISEGITTPLKRFSTKIGSGGGQEKGQAAERPSSPVRSEPPIDLTNSPIATEDVRTQAEDPWNAYVIPGTVLCQALTLQGLLTALSLQEALSRHHVSLFIQFGPYTDLRRFLADPSLPDPSSPQLSATAIGMPRTTTVEFAPTVTRHYVPLSPVPSGHGDGARDPPIDERLRFRRQISRDSSHSRRYPGVGGQSQLSLTRNPSQPNIDPTGLGQAQASQTDFGGFPMPHVLLGMLFRRLFPGTAKRLRRTVTVPATTALAGGDLGRTASISVAGRNLPEGSKPVAYISFDAIVGRNSSFQMLTNEQLEELGGVEYRGLNALLWLVALVSIPIAGKTC